MYAYGARLAGPSSLFRPLLGDTFTAQITPLLPGELGGVKTSRRFISHIPFSDGGFLSDTSSWFGGRSRLFTKHSVHTVDASRLVCVPMLFSKSLKTVKKLT